jgi:hypothetical protein
MRDSIGPASRNGNGYPITVRVDRDKVLLWLGDRKKSQQQLEQKKNKSALPQSES